jgi:hypothetical protein
MPASVNHFTRLGKVSCSSVRGWWYWYAPISLGILAVRQAYCTLAMAAETLRDCIDKFIVYRDELTLGRDWGPSCVLRVVVYII